MGALTVTILGCDGSYAGPGGACSGYLIRSADAAVWLDTGAGTLSAVQRHVDLADLTAIVVSHEHPDHWLELPTLFNCLAYFVDRAPLPVYTTAGTAALARYLQPRLDTMMPCTILTDGAELQIADQQWSFSRTDHYVETLAPLVRSRGASVAYTADTGPAWSVAALATAIDLVVSEASFLAEREHTGTLHLSARQAGRAARGVAGELVLTHLAPGVDAARAEAEGSEAFGAPVQMAAVDRHFVV